MPQNLLISLFLFGLLSACGEEKRHLQAPPHIPQPSPSSFEPETNPPPAPPEATWHSLATLEVEGYPDRTAVIDVLVQSKNGTCELVKKHARIATDKKWSPLPLAIYSKKTGGALSPVFDQTLDFPNEYKKIRPQGADALVEFVRHNVFRAFVRAEARGSIVQGKSICSAQLSICPRPKQRARTYTCDREWRQLRKLVVVIDVPRHLASMGRPERERDDVVKMKIHTRKLNDSGVGVGEVSVEDFTDFQAQ